MIILLFAEKFIETKLILSHHLSLTAFQEMQQHSSLLNEESVATEFLYLPCWRRWQQWCLDHGHISIQVLLTYIISSTSRQS